jgi:DNA-binding IscR family transcriptional regulator
MTTIRIVKLVKTLCSSGPVRVEEVIKEAESMGVKRKYAEENLGMLASEGFIKIQRGLVTLVK